MQHWVQKTQISFGPSCNQILISLTTAHVLISLITAHVFSPFLPCTLHSYKSWMSNHHLCVQAGISSQSQLENFLFPFKKTSGFSYTASRFHQTQRVRLIFLQTKVNDNQPLPDLVEELSKGEISGSTVIEEVWSPTPPHFPTKRGQAKNTESIVY